jgi:hypothetical protein
VVGRELTVSLFYRPGPPAHYVARLGADGQLQGWGWDERQALDDLARLVFEYPPPELAAELTSSLVRIARWLEEHAPPILTDDQHAPG